MIKTPLNQSNTSIEPLFSPDDSFKTKDIKEDESFKSERKLEFSEREDDLDSDENEVVIKCKQRLDALVEHIQNIQNSKE